MGERTLLCSKRTLNLIELAFVVLQESQMHGVVARQRIVQYLSCALIYSLLSAQDKNILKGGMSVCQSLKRSLGVPV